MKGSIFPLLRNSCLPIWSKGPEGGVEGSSKEVCEAAGKKITPPLLMRNNWLELIQSEARGECFVLLWLFPSLRKLCFGLCFCLVIPNLACGLWTLSFGLWTLFMTYGPCFVCTLVLGYGLLSCLVNQHWWLLAFVGVCCTDCRWLLWESLGWSFTSHCRPICCGIAE